MAAGCRLQTWSLPEELSDAQRCGSGLPIDIDEVLDFPEKVQDEAAFDEAFDKLCREVK